MRDSLDVDQLARLGQAASDHDLDAGQLAGLEAMARLRNAEAEWRAARLAVIGDAARLLQGGVLEIGHVLAALDISYPTWRRRMAELRAALEGRGLAAVEAAGDQAEARAKETGRE